MKASVRVAVVLPDAPPETLPMVSPAMAGLATSAKLDFATPAAKVVSSSATVTVAPFRLASVSAEGLVAETDRAVGEHDKAPPARCRWTPGSRPRRGRWG